MRSRKGRKRNQRSVDTGNEKEGVREGWRGRCEGVRSDMKCFGLFSGKRVV